jgi:glyceraldehyde 3-phosphate dehydrogenase (phosphorylating)
MPRTTVGLAGFGRVGRSLFRLLYGDPDAAGHPELDLVAVADASAAEALLYLIRFDTIHGRFPRPVTLEDGALVVGGRRVRLLENDRPGEIPWGELGVSIVIEASNKPRTRTELEAHLAAGAERVILCTPPVEPPDLTVVPGVSDHLLRPEHRIVSNASCTVHAAAPVAKILDEAFGIERAFLTTVHAYSDQQRLADVPEKDLRRGRAAAENVIPQETHAGEMLEELLPALAGKVTAMSMNVPVANGSGVDLVCWHRKPVTVEAVNEALRQAIANPPWAGILAYETEPIVSSDVIRTPDSGAFDSLATMVLGDRVSKTLTWFDNSWGYAHRVVELAARSARPEGTP